jgi:hypothetical protein
MLYIKNEILENFLQFTIRIDCKLRFSKADLSIEWRNLAFLFD